MSNAGGSGSDESEFAFEFGVDGHGQPIEYSMPSMSVTVPIHWASVWQQDNVGEFHDSGQREEEAFRPPVWGQQLPQRATTLTGRIDTSIAGIGDGAVTWSLRPAGRCRPRHVTVWINAFLPYSVGKNILRVVPAGPYKGQTAVTGLSESINDLFLTDDRSFSTSPIASSRMQSLIEIDLKDETVRRERHRCSPTVEVDDDGDVECGPRSAPATRMRFGALSVSGPLAARQFRLEFDGAANNACWAGSPDIDYRGRLQLTYRPDSREVAVEYDVFVEPFPAFEMYARLDSGPVVPLFRRHPDEDATPLDITGPPNVRFRGSESLTCR